MPTLWSKTLIPTARQVPAEAEVPSHQLMLRAGYIHKLGAGVYDYLPLGVRSLRKVMAIIREEMDAAGAIEVFLPALQPIELWEQTGRRAAYGENLFVLNDRHSDQPNLALGPTHEEVMTSLVGACVHSYKQLPLTLYQIQTKFRDEFRPRFGVLRSREFQMKDAYSFHLALEGPGGLDETYQKQYDAYCRIFSRCGLPYEIVEAQSGPIGGSASHEFMVPSPIGEDVILKSDKGNYAANVEKCGIGERPIAANFVLKGTDYYPGVDLDHLAPDADPTGIIEAVHTPNCSSIEELCSSWKKFGGGKLKPQNTLKTIIYRGPTTPTDRLDQVYDWVIAVVRGDHYVNEPKLRQLCGDQLTLAEHEIVAGSDLPFGFLGPHIANDQLKCWTVVDPDAAQDQFWVTGANKADYHARHFHWARDFFENLYVLDWHKKHQGCGFTVADIRNAVDGDPSPENDGGVLQATKGIEIGHVFKLGDKYAEALDVKVLDEHNERRPLVMGCYGIGVNRILAAAIEHEGGHDANGIIWPASIAPYTVLITPIKYEGTVRETANQLANELENIPGAGIDVLIDDRGERPGVKFKDADLIGIPIRITVGDKALANGQVEVKPRSAAQPVLVAVGDVANHVVQLLEAL